MVISSSYSLKNILLFGVFGVFQSDSFYARADWISYSIFCTGQAGNDGIYLFCGDLAGRIFGRRNEKSPPLKGGLSGALR